MMTEGPPQVPGQKEGACAGGVSTSGWTEEEQGRLEEALRDYPSDRYSIAAQCAKAAIFLPRKSVRDVAARIRLMPCSSNAASASSRYYAGDLGEDDDDFSRRVDQLLRANVEVIARIRDNLHKIDLLDNIPLMREFDRNVAAAFALLRRLENAKMPPFPVRVNTMFLGGGCSSNESAAAFDGNGDATPTTARPTAAHPHAGRSAAHPTLGGQGQGQGQGRQQHRPAAAAKTQNQATADHRRGGFRRPPRGGPGLTVAVSPPPSVPQQVTASNDDDDHDHHDDDDDDDANPTTARASLVPTVEPTAGQLPHQTAAAPPQPTDNDLASPSSPA